ncbi:MAG TPA: NAD(P)H-hydrate dehydratase [Pyrinomonadaceae bacterium]|jgi:hydroxyethylthiazole kinase-like uncharacterized protein yjeF
MALPQPDEEGDKEERGRVLVVGGSAEMPGALVLAGIAVLRAGAGKLQMATVRSIAQHVAAAVPEGRVFALPETRVGAIAASAADALVERAEQAQSVLVGPGMVDEEAVTRLLKRMLNGLKTPTLVLDAAALASLATERELLHALRGRAVITPHAGEMASICGLSKERVERDRLALARRAARELRAVVVLKGRETLIVAPEGRALRNRAGNVGLATSGSGDTLSGVVAGLAARGATPFQAAAWGVYLHARAGDRLARRIGRLGFLARELLAEIPSLMSELGGSRSARSAHPV